MFFKDFQRLSADYSLYGLLDTSRHQRSTFADRRRRRHIQFEHERIARRRHPCALSKAHDMAVRYQRCSDELVGQKLAIISTRFAGIAFKRNESLFDAYESHTGTTCAQEICVDHKSTGHKRLPAVLCDTESVQRLQVFVRRIGIGHIFDAMV